MDEIEVFAEITCPFTHVGLHRLVEERARRDRATPHFRVRAWPLELVNGAPLDGAAVADKAAALREQVAPDLFTHVDPANWPTTSRPAFALVAKAYRHGAAVGEAVSLAVRDALFERGQDISDPDVLEHLADSYGLGPVMASDLSQVEEDWDEGRRRNVAGSPHFFLGDDDVFCPTLRITKPDGQLHVEIDQPEFDAFVGRVFA